MKDSLSIKFNHKAPKKEIKTENDIKVGVRRRSDGSSMFVRAGKIVRVETTRKKPEDTLNEYRQAAAEATAKKHQLAKEHHRPASVSAYQPPKL